MQKPIRLNPKSVKYELNFCLYIIIVYLLVEFNLSYIVLFGVCQISVFEYWFWYSDWDTLWGVYKPVLRYSLEELCVDEWCDMLLLRSFSYGSDIHPSKCIFIHDFNSFSFYNYFFCPTHTGFIIIFISLVLFIYDDNKLYGLDCEYEVYNFVTFRRVFFCWMIQSRLRFYA